MAAVHQRGALGHREADAGARCAVGVGGGAIVAVEDALPVGHGNHRTEAVHGEDHLGIGLGGADGDGGAEDGVFAGVVNVLRQQHDHQLAVAAEDQVFVVQIDDDLHAGQPVAEAGHNLFDQRATPTGVAWMVTSPASRRAVVSRRVVSSLNTPVCSSISATSSAWPAERWPISPRPVRGGADGCQRRLVGVGQAVQNRGAQLLGAALGLQVALVGEGTVAVEGNGNQRGDGVVGQRAGVAAHHQAADGHRAQPQNAAAQSGVEVVVGGFEIVDILRQFLRVRLPDSRPGRSRAGRRRRPPPPRARKSRAPARPTAAPAPCADSSAACAG